jgi:hypothetical protein
VSTYSNNLFVRDFGLKICQGGILNIVIHFFKIAKVIPIYINLNLES